MPTHTKQLREVIVEVIEGAHPAPVSLDQLYEAAESRFRFDEKDLASPTHRGVSVNEPSWKRNLRNALQHGKAAGTLVNERRNSWRLPTPNPATALDPATAWAQVRAAAERALVKRAVFLSFEREQRYEVNGVLDGKIIITRIDSAAPESLSRGEVERAVVYLNAAGGRVGRRTLHYTVAKEVTLVELHPQLHWDEASDSIVALGTTATVPAPMYRDFGEAPDDDPTQLDYFARKVRAGQPRFRKNLLNLYAHACAISGWGPDDVLEAAHIDLHANGGINKSGNGVLLRSDLHTLFDSGMLRIHPETLEVVLTPRLRGTHYWPLNGTRLRARVDGSQPDSEYLWTRWKSAEDQRVV